MESVSVCSWRVIILPVWLEEHFLLMMLIAASLISGIWLWMMRDRLGMTLFCVLLISVLHTLYGVLCVKIFALVEDGSFQWAGKMSLFGGVFLMPLAYYIGAKTAKRNMREVFDVFAVCTIETLFFARINCLVSGCCVGRPMPGIHGLRWPTREAELCYYAVLLILELPHVIKKETNGKFYPLYMLTYGVFRFATEFLRDSGTDRVFHIAHIWSVLSICIGAGIYAELQNRQKKDKKNTTAKGGKRNA